MKYKYIYKTSDGVRREGKIDAPNRDQVFKQLNAQGIRPIKVLAGDGSLDNGAVNGVRKRVVAAISVTAALVVGVVAFMVGRDAPIAPRDGAGGLSGRVTLPTADVEFLTSTERRQIVGDVAIIEKGIATGWEDVFPHEGERFLASFAIPGVPAGLRNTTEDEVRAALARSQEESLIPDGGRGATRPTTPDGGQGSDRPTETPQQPVGSGVPSRPDSPSRLAGLSLEGKQISAIVEGMKNELRAFIADGKHTIVEYGQRLVERQEQELTYYNRTKTEIEAAAKSNMPRKELLDLWEQRNAQLRQIGVKLVRMPEE